MKGLLSIRSVFQLSQLELGRLLGCTRTLIGMMETGRRLIAVDRMPAVMQLSHLAEGAEEFAAAQPSVMPDQTLLAREMKAVNRNTINLQFHLEQQTEDWQKQEKLLYCLDYGAQHIHRKTELRADAFALLHMEKRENYKGWDATEIAIAKARLAGYEAQKAVLEGMINAASN